MTMTTNPAELTTPTPGDLAKLRATRTAAQAWKDTTDDDAIKAARALEQAQEYQQNAQHRLADAEEAYASALRAVQHPVAMRRVG